MVMENIVIRFVEKSVKPTGTLYKVEDTNGQQYGCWDIDAGEYLVKSIGESVDVEIKVNGKYKNILSVGNAQKANHKSVDPVMTANTRVIPHKDTSIVAQCLTKIVYGGLDIDPKAVLDTYNYFLKAL